jgi:hypothetical protein
VNEFFFRADGFKPCLIVLDGLLEFTATAQRKTCQPLT